MRSDKKRAEITVWTIAAGVCLGVLIAASIVAVTAHLWLRVTFQPDTSAYEGAVGRNQADNPLQGQLESGSSSTEGWVAGPAPSAARKK